MDFYREMPVSISEKQYAFTKFCRDHITRRLAFDDLAQSIFGLSFEPWYQNGHWSDKYIPYTLFDGDLAVANVSVNTMTFTSANAGRLHGIQLGTVMTHPAYRGRGLSRFLMEQVLAEWKDKWDFLYLFANDTVLDFYPQFGFYPVKESCYQKHTPTFLSLLRSPLCISFIWISLKTDGYSLRICLSPTPSLLFKWPIIPALLCFMPMDF